MPQAYQKIGRYHIVREIAHGGMATVYRGILAGVEGFEKDVAIKKIQPYWSQQKEFIDMLIDEARILLHLHHPNIVEVIELGKEADTYFIVMEFVDGFDLRKIIKKLTANGRGFNTALACHIIKQVCLGLEFAHSRKNKTGEPLNIVHRDISPQNIMISRDGHVKIADFGIAKVRGKTTETAAGFLKGKFSYMSPEQAGGTIIDARTDLFALGSVFFELLTGQKCFDGTSDFDIIERVRQAQANLSLIANEDLKQIVARSLNKDPDKRHQTATELRREIETFEKQNQIQTDADDVRSFLEENLATEIAKAILVEDEILEHTHTPHKHTLQTTPLPVFDLPEPQGSKKTNPQESQYSSLVGPTTQPDSVSASSPSATTLLEKTWIEEAPVPSADTSDVDDQRIVVRDETSSHSTQSLFARFRAAPKKLSRKKQILAAASVFGVLIFVFLIVIFSGGPDKATLPTPAEQKASTDVANQAVQDLPPIQKSIDDPSQQKPPVDEPQPVVEQEKPAELKITPPETAQQTAQDQPTSTAPSGSATETIDPTKFGVLKVSSRPWGLVEVEGLGTKSAPALFKTPVGTFTVVVKNSQFRKSVSKEVTVDEGVFVECTAVFERNSSKMTCN